MIGGMRFADWAVRAADRYLPARSELHEQYIAYRDFDLLAYAALFQANDDGVLRDDDRQLALAFIKEGAFDKKSAHALIRAVLTPAMT